MNRNRSRSRYPPKASNSRSSTVPVCNTIKIMFWVAESLASMARAAAIRCLFDGLAAWVYHGGGGEPVRIFAVGASVATPYAVWGGGSWALVPLLGLLAVVLGSCFHHLWGKK